MKIQDAVHGYLEFSEEEKQIIESPLFQRLRRIRQLGLTSYVYPSATHTRFQHSLGVAHLTGKYADRLNLSKERRRELRTAALLHDTGHGPFSHASELMTEKKGVSHEDFSCEVADRLENLYSADRKRIHRIIRGELEIGSIVSGDIDADRMDYLIRDAHATGVEHGQIDADTIIRLAEIDSRRLVYDKKAITALESLLTSRFHMTKSVYKHHAVEIAEKMLQRSLESYLQEGNKLEKIMRMDDFAAHQNLLESDSASKIFRKIRNRELYKRALSWDESSVSHSDLKTLEKSIRQPQKLETEIAERAKVAEHEVIVDPPETPDMNSIDIKVKKEGEIHEMSEVSPFPGMLETAEWQTVKMNVYCPKEIRSKVQSASEEVLSRFLDR